MGNMIDLTAHKERMKSEYDNLRAITEELATSLNDDLDIGLDANLLLPTILGEIAGLWVDDQVDEKAPNPESADEAEAVANSIKQWHVLLEGVYAEMVTDMVEKIALHAPGELSAEKKGQSLYVLANMVVSGALRSTIEGMQKAAHELRNTTRQ